MRKAIIWGVLAAVCFSAATANAAEITLERSAVDKLVSQSLFRDQGRMVLVGGMCGTYLDQPSVMLGNGRVQIRSHLTASVGIPVGRSCAGLNLASWTVVSGRPVAAGGIVRLEDVRIDQVDDPDTRQVLAKLGLTDAFPRAVELDVRSAVQNMLSRGDNPIQTTVDAFTFQDVSIVGDSLHLGFEFKLTGR